jgi:hypothetical protein
VHRQLAAGVSLAWLASGLAGCDYGSSQENVAPVAPGIQTTQFADQVRRFDKNSEPGRRESVKRVVDPKGREELLKTVIRQIETAATTPGGTNFADAVDNLNSYFEGFVEPENYKMRAEMREYLLPRIKEKGVVDLETGPFVKSDGRHVEDCLMYHAVASRVAGSSGDELERVRALFQWVVEQVVLVPAGALAPPGLYQAQARPYDVMLRGMAVEEAGGWAERAWLFMSLCRQLGIDVGLLTYMVPAQKERIAVAWCCAAVVDGKAYLFDTRIGREIAGPDGTGVATLEEAATIPEVLDRLDLPGQSPYHTTAAQLAAGKIGVLIDSSPGYFSSRMRLLQDELAGKNRMILYRDPLAQRDNLARALGPRFAEAELWSLPLEVEYRLFHDSQFVTSTLFPIQIFDARLPLLSARLDQLRGELDLAKEKYVKFRKAEQVLLGEKKTPAPPDLRHALDMYATYFLALCHLDQHRPDQAMVMLKLALEELPDPKGNGPIYEFFRWGVECNLARLYDAQGDTRRAIAYYCQVTPTLQYHGNLLRARELVWRDPMAAPPDPLPAAPLRKTFAPPPAPPMVPAPPMAPAAVSAAARSQ